MTTVPPPARIPLGHVIAAHHLFGWCLYCPGRTAAEELGAWWAWSTTVPEIADAIRRTQPG